MQNAIALMNYSARYIEISFKIDASKFLDITINDQITLIDERFEGGKISGKIIKIHFSASSKKRILHITLGCCSHNFSENIAEQIDEYLRDLESENQKENGDTNSSSQFSLADIVRDVEVINPPEEQEKILRNSNAKSVAELESLLKKHPTKIKVFLASLKGSASKNINLPKLFLK